MVDVELLSILIDTLFVGIHEDWMPSFEGNRAPRFRGVDVPDVKKAYDVANETLARNPTNIQALFERGVVCRTIGWYPEAMADFVKVIRLQPKNALAWLNYSEILTNMGEHEKGGKARKIALELDPALK